VNLSFQKHFAFAIVKNFQKYIELLLCTKTGCTR